MATEKTIAAASPTEKTITMLGADTAAIVLKNDYAIEREWTRNPATNPHWIKVGRDETMADPDDSDYVQVSSAFDSLGIRFTLIDALGVTVGTISVNVDTGGLIKNGEIVFDGLNLSPTQWVIYATSVRMEPISGVGEKEPEVYKPPP